MASVASSYVVYILRCADSSFYTGMTTDLDMRLAEHRDGIDPGSYTHARRPVQVVWSRNFQTHDEAFRCERQIKG